MQAMSKSHMQRLCTLPSWWAKSHTLGDALGVPYRQSAVALGLCGS